VIAAKEKLSVRYVRLLAPLAFLSPRVIEAIANDEVPADLTPTALTRNLPLNWAEQERLLSRD
jgi:site-specific DNA recombinase